MKKIALTVSFVIFVFLVYGPTSSQAENTFAAKILTYFAQADTNKDVVLGEKKTLKKGFSLEKFTAKDGTSIEYKILSPKTMESGRTYPLVLALHGRGGTTVAAPKLASDEFRTKFPCFVMVPESTKAGHWARPAAAEKKTTKAMLPAALEALDAVIKKHPVDTQRIYVTGQSMGGGGTFGALSLRPNFFAAAVPVAGGWDPSEADRLKHVPIWVFHGDNDKRVLPKYSRDMVAALKKAGGDPKYTEFKGVGHNSWNRTYDSLATWQWLFKQQKNKREE